MPLRRRAAFNRVMADLTFIALTVLFFVVSALVVKAVERL